MAAAAPLGVAAPLSERAARDTDNDSNKMGATADGAWFHGVVLCVSGMWADRERAVAAVCRGGGAYSGTLHKGCTHLAVAAPEVRGVPHPTRRPRA
jgi:hypothetical protein